VISKILLTEFILLVPAMLLCLSSIDRPRQKAAADIFLTSIFFSIVATMLVAVWR
jgi:hypothetical protein